ncbi:MAG: GIY-YIG nuclease family protein [Prevotella sp.]|nr:GIY-YIG nuclease family protein [Prevotella sp.]
MNTSLVAYTYILECSNGAYYVGSTNDLERRLVEHQAGEGSRYTSAHLPVKLVYWEEYQNIDEAFRRERQLHGWSRAKKEALINGDIEKLKSASTGCPSTALTSSGTSQDRMLSLSKHRSKTIKNIN